MEEKPFKVNIVREEGFLQYQVIAKEGLELDETTLIEEIKETKKRYDELIEANRSKLCRKCGTKDVSQFYKSSYSYCIPCTALYMKENGFKAQKEYHERRKQGVLNKPKLTKEEKKELAKKKSKEYYQKLKEEDPKRLAEHSKKYYEAHKAQVQERTRNYYIKRRDDLKQKYHLKQKLYKEYLEKMKEKENEKIVE